MEKKKHEHAKAQRIRKSAAQPFPPTKVEDVFECLKYTGKPRTVEEMEAAIAVEVRRRLKSGRYDLLKADSKSRLPDACV